MRWNVAASTVLDDEQRARILDRLAGRIVDGVLTIVASEQRSQLQNRAAARARLDELVAQALAPPPPPRRATRPTRAAREQRLDSKRRRGEIKSNRRRPIDD